MARVRVSAANAKTPRLGKPSPGTSPAVISAPPSRSATSKWSCLSPNRAIHTKDPSSERIAIPATWLPKQPATRTDASGRETDEFHRNVRCILDLVLPGLTFDDQLAKAWITNTYLCSAARETGPVSASAEKECAGRYLRAQLQLLSGRPVVALGTKAKRRALRLCQAIPDLRDRLFFAYAASPPGARSPQALPSWRTAAEKARALMRHRLRTGKRPSARENPR